MSAATVPAIVLPSWMKAAVRCGFKLEPIIAEEGIELDLLHLQDAQVSAAALERVLDRCIAHAGAAHFPFVAGETFAFEYLPEVETYLTTSSSLRDAAKVLEWLPALVNPLLRAHLNETHGQARLELNLHGNTPSRSNIYNAEGFFASIIKFGHMLAGSDTGFQALHFQHPAPNYLHKYHAYFDMPVRFNQPHNALLCAPGALDKPLGCDFPALHRQAEKMVAERVALRRQRSLGEQVVQVLKREPALLAGGLDAVAQKLSMGPRTLQRRLRANDEQFARLLDHARYDQAQRMLKAGRDFETIAEALCFSDRRSFTRAFKRWSGQTPSEFRAVLR